MTEPERIRLDELPESPVGWTKVQTMHLNFGGGKGAASYELRDEQGRVVEGIGYMYNTKEKTHGFTLTLDYSGPLHMTWVQLRKAYREARR